MNEFLEKVSRTWTQGWWKFLPEMQPPSVSEVAVGLAVFALSLTALILLRWLVSLTASKVSPRLPAKARRPLKELCAGLSLILFTLFSITAGLLATGWFSERYESFIESLRDGILLFQLVLCCQKVLIAVFEEYRQTQVGSAQKSALGIVRFAVELVLWSGAFLLFLDNLGFDVTSLLAGLGIGGIAVALAIQNVLGDVLGSVSIVLERPFSVGDFIMVGDKLGTVERVGVKTVRVRSLSGEQIIFPNSDLLSSRVHNFTRMDERRVVQHLSLVYSTTPDQLKEAKQTITRIIEDTDHCRLDRVHFAEFGAYSLDFEAVYYIDGADYNLFMDVKELISLEIVRIFDEKGLDFAFPTTTLDFPPKVRTESVEVGRREAA